MQSASRLQWMGPWTELTCYTHCSNAPLGLLLNDADDDEDEKEDKKKEEEEEEEEKEEEEEEEEEDKGRSYSHQNYKIRPSKVKKSNKISQQPYMLQQNCLYHSVQLTIVNLLILIV